VPVAIAHRCGAKDGVEPGGKVRHPDVRSAFVKVAIKRASPPATSGACSQIMPRSVWVLLGRIQGSACAGPKDQGGRGFVKSRAIEDSAAAPGRRAHVRCGGDPEVIVVFAGGVAPGLRIEPPVARWRLNAMAARHGTRYVRDVRLRKREIGMD
jgi:hypothetical protein